jgi:ABC-2 type transport system ATP-binding protein
MRQSCDNSTIKLRHSLDKIAPVVLKTLIKQKGQKMNQNHQPVIETSGLIRRFGDLVAVDNLDLCVPRGSVYGFLGPNGAGKTTTIRMLLGLIRPDGGKVHIFGERLDEHRLKLMKRVGALVETPSLYPHLTGRENLEVTRRLIGAPRQQIEQVLATVHLEQAAEHCVKGYSTGMRQRLALALALLGEPDLLILDEPTNGLDPAGIREMRGFLRRLPQAHGVTVFLSSHLLSEVEQIATHIGIVSQGRLLFQGTPDELQAHLDSQVTLGVDRPEAAARTLTEKGWSVGQNGGHRLHVAVNDRSDVTLINAQLVQGGINVFHLNLEQPSLEDVFLRLTQ